MSSQEATQRGDLDEVKTELERDPGAINDTDEDGYTACMFGAARGYADIVDFLIRNRADPNIQISAGSPGTPGGAPSETGAGKRPPGASPPTQRPPWRHPRSPSTSGSPLLRPPITWPKKK